MCYVFPKKNFVIIEINLISKFQHDFCKFIFQKGSYMDIKCREDSKEDSKRTSLSEEENIGMA